MEEEFVSPLGTQEYWEEQYNQEIKQFHNNETQVGEIWFGAQLQKRNIKYILSKYDNKDQYVFDVGYGNGMFLYQMAKNGYKNLYGIDYCESSLKLAEEIISKKEKKHNKVYNIKLFVEDINNKTNKIDIKFDLIHDKGSMDAFLLNKANNLDSYVSYILSYSKVGTIFVITSCNNTKEELRAKFTEEKGFKFVDELKNRSFSFGGHEGQNASTQIYEVIKLN